MHLAAKATSRFLASGGFFPHLKAHLSTTPILIQLPSTICQTLSSYAAWSLLHLFVHIDIVCHPLHDPVRTLAVERLLHLSRAEPCWEGDTYLLYCQAEVKLAVFREVRMVLSR